MGQVTLAGLIALKSKLLPAVIRIIITFHDMPYAVIRISTIRQGTVVPLVLVHSLVLAHPEHHGCMSQHLRSADVLFLRSPPRGAPY